MYETAQSFFQNLFSNPGNAFPLMTYNLPTKLSSEDKQFLTSVPHESKIRLAVFQINPNNAPDTDGYSAKFLSIFLERVKTRYHTVCSRFVCSWAVSYFLLSLIHIWL